MSIKTWIFLLLILSINAFDTQSAFVTKYINQNYIPLINKTQAIEIENIHSQSACLFKCLSSKDCLIVAFNQSNNQCLLYNIYPIIDQEFFPDNNMIIFVFQQQSQLPSSISNTNWLISRLNGTTPSKLVSIQKPRCLIIDIFGYLLTLSVNNNSTFINRYDRTSLTLIQSSRLSMNYTSIGMLGYSNGMIFVSSQYPTVYIFDHINFELLGTISCGSLISQPRDIIYIEDKKTLIIASQNTRALVFVLFYSPNNYTCLSSTSPPNGDPQGLFKLNDTFFHVTSWGTLCIYSYHYNGTTWIPSLFANISQVVRGSGINGGHIQLDNLQRRWMMLVGFGAVLYDQ